MSAPADPGIGHVVVPAKASRVPRIPLLLLAAVVSVFALLLLAGYGPWSGPVLMRIGARHGVHEGDLPVLVAWACSMYCCWRLWRH
jgi:hypothetical protein